MKLCKSTKNEPNFLKDEIHVFYNAEADEAKCDIQFFLNQLHCMSRASNELWRTALKRIYLNSPKKMQKCTVSEEGLAVKFI